RAGLVLGGVAAVLAAGVAARAFVRAAGASAAPALAVATAGAGVPATCAGRTTGRRLARLRDARHAVVRRAERARRS
ncbi:MAG TPA: hypothetical protein VHF51_03820, partial [Solirubrobacteraceae bacterium]|nr:hypothetical protein [Solirubrobacteraceae bacterium]